MLIFILGVFGISNVTFVILCHDSARPFELYGPAPLAECPENNLDAVRNLRKARKHGQTKKRNRFSNNGTTRRLTMSTARVWDARCWLRIENSSGCSFRLLDAKMWIFDWDKTTTDLFHKTTTFRHDTSVSQRIWKFKGKKKGKCRKVETKCVSENSEFLQELLCLRLWRSISSHRLKEL